jgi:hypothetical protein
LQVEVVTATDSVAWDDAADEAEAWWIEMRLHSSVSA